MKTCSRYILRLEFSNMKTLYLNAWYLMERPCDIRVLNDSLFDKAEFGKAK